MRTETIALAIAITLCSAAHAESTTNATKATAALASSCRLLTTNVVFGEYNPAAEDHLTSTQTVTYTCTRGTPITITTADGSSTSATNSYGILASMKYSSNTLYFQVFNPIAKFWNDDIDGANGSTVISKTGSGREETLSLDYRIIKNQFVPPGIYTATNTIKMTF